MIRLILVVLAIGIFFILTPVLYLIKWIIGRFDAKKGDLCALHMVQFILKVILFLAGVKTTVIGEENVPKDQSVLYILNHRSFFDIVLTYSRCPSLTGYIAKKELQKIPFLSWWMKWLRCLFLDRKDIKEGLKTILNAIDYIKEGISIAIFPEGTRNKEASETTLLPFHEGSFKIATKSGCPIIPVAISHSSAILEDHFPFIKATHVVLEYGTPIYPKELSREELKFLGKKTQEIIQEMLIKNHAVL